MRSSLNCLEAYEVFADEVTATQPFKQAKRTLNELRSGFHILISQWGFQRNSSSRKMSMAETEAARRYLKILPVEKLLSARQDLRKAFQTLGTPKSSQHTYGNRVIQFLDWCEQQTWWPDARLLRLQDQCCPEMRNKNGSVSNIPLTERRGRYLYYRLTEQETPPILQAELDRFFQFQTASIWHGRVIEPVEPSTAKEYLKEIRLFFGFLLRYHSPLIPLEQLSLELLVPKVAEEELDELTNKQQKQLWKPKKQWLESWLFAYFSFLKEQMVSTSPRTKRNKLCAALAVAKFLYTDQVEREEEYNQIPIFNTIACQFTTVLQDVQEWDSNKEYVSNQENKWPDVKENETALQVVKSQLVDQLRLECRPRNKRGDFRKGYLIATSLQNYLKWVFLAYLPARRQQETRTTRIATSCSVKRPNDVPPDGLYQPLPPLEQRERNRKGRLADNYIYRTYTYNKKHYQDGVWVFDTQHYKTRKNHGAQKILIPNRHFADGTTLYDHLERYVYGWWVAEGYKNRQVYDWWQPEMKGRRGRWITAGRLDFEPEDARCLPTSQKTELWTWGYLFPMPRGGGLANPNAFAGSFEQTSHRLLNKRITPHTMRYIWATWAFQVGLTDAQLRSLAYAMGHTVETLRKMYERCTPEEKRQPIEEAIDELLFSDLEGNQ